MHLSSTESCDPDLNYGSGSNLFVHQNQWAYDGRIHTTSNVNLLGTPINLTDIEDVVRLPNRPLSEGKEGIRRISSELWENHVDAQVPVPSTVTRLDLPLVPVLVLSLSFTQNCT
jgi:hypothetical protein